MDEGVSRTVLSLQHVKHGGGYIEGISQVNTLSNTHTLRLEGNVKGEREREAGGRISSACKNQQMLSLGNRQLVGFRISRQLCASSA